MKKITFILIAFALLSSGSAFAQWRINAGIDILKTEFFPNSFPDVQLGVEAAYFITGSVAMTGGIEIWDKPANQLGGSLGVRYYPVNPVFLRMRGILAQDSDFAIGLGYAIPISDKWRFETMADYYAVNSDFALRLGVGVRL